MVSELDVVFRRPPNAKRSGMAQAGADAAAAAAPAAETIPQAAPPEVQELVELRKQAQAAQQRALQLMQTTVTEMQQLARVMRVAHGAQLDANQAYEQLQAALAAQQLHSAGAKVGDEPGFHAPLPDVQTQGSLAIAVCRADTGVVRKYADAFVRCAA